MMRRSPSRLLPFVIIALVVAACESDDEVADDSSSAEPDASSKGSPGNDSGRDTSVTADTSLGTDSSTSDVRSDSPPGDDAGAPTCSSSADGGCVPMPAASAGYMNHTLSTQSFTTSNVDMSATYATGKQWYLTNFFNDITPASAVTLNGDGTVSAADKRATGNYNGALATIGQIETAPYFVGTAFGCGAYIDAVVSFDDSAIPASPSGLNWPSMWADSYELLLGLPSLQWPGQASGYSHWLELDIFEKINPGGSYFGTLHDWFGVQSPPQTCPGSNDCEMGSYDRNKITPPAAIDWSQWHRVSTLWVPATSTSNGKIEFYFDDELMSSATETWSQYTNQPPPAVNPSDPWVTTFPPWAFGIGDQRRLAILFGSGTVTPINVQSVDVWQGPAACNVTN